MKTLFLAILALVIAVPSFALDTKQATPFSNYSVADGSAHYSAAYLTRGFRQKTAIFQGIAVSGHTNTTISGTILAQCGPTSSGPWNTCSGNQNYGSYTITSTANGIFSWEDASPYVRFSWTKTAGEITAWFFYQ